MSSNQNNSNSSSLSSSERSSDGFSSKNSVRDIIELPFFSLTILLAVAYTALLIIRPIFRRTKLNWFTMNICLTSVFLSIIMLSMNINRQLNTPDLLPCRVQGFFLIMTASHLMYAHCAVAFSRLLTIVYASKPLFRSNICLWSCIGSGWLVALLVSLLYLFVDNFTCASISEPSFLSYYTLITTLLIPVLILVVCNSRVLLHVRKSTRQVQVAITGGRISRARDVHLLKVMIVTFAIFFIGWTPVFVTQLFQSNDRLPEILDACFQILPPFSMLLDVIFLVYTNRPVRLFLKQYMVCR